MRRRSLWSIGFSIFGLWLAVAPALAQQAWLVTYGTAERVEEQFGHNAIWIRDSARGIDEVYNFGFFDFDKPGFYREFIFGEMIYFALARSPEEELAYYRWRDRDVRVQLLNLTASQIQRLTDWLEARIQPETREFRYDYYFYNCSNRVRDGLDYALDGTLSEFARSRPASLTFREHTRRMLADDPLLYFGIQVGLGRPADRPRTLWEEMFLPEVVAAAVADMQVEIDGEPQPLVLADDMLYASTRPDDPHAPRFAWTLTLTALAATLALVLVPLAVFDKRGARLLGVRLWLILSSAAGLLLAFFWLATDHQTAWRNENLLLLNPLLIALWRFGGGRLKRIAAALIAAGLGLALLLKFLPGAQWNYELLLWLVPAQAIVLSIKQLFLIETANERE
ncbi:MAG: DUF4105 domain-containing protein [Wenzhouxiangellaceae bacterium]|nr:DUF4105 domain-containing protein [Wenzhouxiangellaceae bacterium]